MRPTIETKGTEMTILLPEELDHPISDQIRKETDRIMRKIYIRTIIFDFRDTVFMDSSGIGLIMGRYRALGMRRDSIQAINVNAYIEKLLCLSGVVKYIDRK